MVLYWSWERRVCSSSRPAGHPRHSSGLTVKLALPVGGRELPRVARRRAAGRSRPARRTRALKSVEAGDARARCGRGSCRSPSRTPPRAQAVGRRAPRGPAGTRSPARTAAAGRAGCSRPREACTMPIESSTVTNCCAAGLQVALGAAEASAGSAPRAPVTACERLSLVETCTVSRARRIAASVDLGVGGGARRSCRPWRRRPRPRRRASRRIVPTVSKPCSRGGSKPNSRSSASRNAAGIGSRRCPSCGRPARWCGRAPGRRPAPGLPMLPRSSRKLTTSWMVGTECLCWVRPIAQQTIVALDGRATAGRARSISLRGQPGRLERSSAQSRRWRALGVGLEARRCARATNACVDTAPGSPPRRSAGGRAPGTAPGRRRAGSAGTGRRVRCRRPTSPGTVCGFLNRISPASGSGLTATICAPCALGLLQRA